jgi:hypothetical protein
MASDYEVEIISNHAGVILLGSFPIVPGVVTKLSARLASQYEGHFVIEKMVADKVITLASGPSDDVKCIEDLFNDLAIKHAKEDAELAKALEEETKIAELARVALAKKNTEAAIAAAVVKLEAEAAAPVAPVAEFPAQ